MHVVVEIRRTHWAAAVRLAIVVSAVAAAIALALSAFGDVSQTALVIAVIVVGFVVSWIHTGRDDGEPVDETARDHVTSPQRQHRSPSARRTSGSHSARRTAMVRIHHSAH